MAPATPFVVHLEAPAARYTVDSYISNHPRVGARLWYRVVLDGRTYAKGFRNHTAAQQYADNENRMAAKAEAGRQALAPLTHARIPDPPDWED